MSLFVEQVTGDRTGELRWTISGKTIVVPYYSLSQRNDSVEAINELIAHYGDDAEAMSRVKHVEDRTPDEIWKENFDQGVVSWSGQDPVSDGNPFTGMTEAIEDVLFDHTTMTAEQRAEHRKRDLANKAAKWDAENAAKLSVEKFHEPGSRTRNLFERSITNLVRSLADPKTPQRLVDGLEYAHRKYGSTGDATNYAKVAGAAFDHYLEKERVTLNNAETVLANRRAAVSTAEAARKAAIGTPPDRPKSKGQYVETFADGSKRVYRLDADGTKVDLGEYVPAVE